MTARFAVDPDIARAATLPAAFYRDAATWSAVRERVFARTWQWLDDLGAVAEPGSLAPRDLAPGQLDEPLLLARDGAGTLRCLSNVCTHRGNLLVREPCRASEIRCGYHSRRFDLAGRMMFMPEFRDVHGFPGPSDHLPEVAFGSIAGIGFAAIDPVAPFDDFVRPVREAFAGLPVAALAHDRTRDREYEVAAHWALYVENYLEGFHIPFVHPALAAEVDHASYATTLHRYASVQVARAVPGAAAFADGVAAHYWWVFPNLMLNVYPWGISVNVVLPQSPERTRVVYRSYVWDAAKLGLGAGGALDRVEHEDEAIVEAVQRGVNSRFYRGGRYSPTREQGVHHFHRLLVEFLDGAG